MLPPEDRKAFECEAPRVRPRAVCRPVPHLRARRFSPRAGGRRGARRRQPEIGRMFHALPLTVRLPLVPVSAGERGIGREVLGILRLAGMMGFDSLAALAVHAAGPTRLDRLQ